MNLFFKLQKGPIKKTEKLHLKGFQNLPLHHKENLKENFPNQESCLRTSSSLLTLDYVDQLGIMRTCINKLSFVLLYRYFN